MEGVNNQPTLCMNNIGHKSIVTVGQIKWPKAYIYIYESSKKEVHYNILSAYNTSQKIN